MANQRICSIEGCDKKHKGHGLCETHLQRFKKYGSTNKETQTERYLKVLLQTNTNECIIWPFAVNNRGYAMMTLYENGERFNLPHRYVCQKTNGPPPSEKHQAAHTCGKGYLGCVNPKHTTWKTQVENEYDKREHDTLLFGEKAPWSKLTELEALIIKYSTLKPKILATTYSISERSISDIRCGKTWKHLP